MAVVCDTLASHSIGFTPPKDLSGPITGSKLEPCVLVTRSSEGVPVAVVTRKCIGDITRQPAAVHPPECLSPLTPTGVESIVTALITAVDSELAALLAGGGARDQESSIPNIATQVDDITVERDAPCRSDNALLNSVIALAKLCNNPEQAGRHPSDPTPSPELFQLQAPFRATLALTFRRVLNAPYPDPLTRSRLTPHALAALQLLSSHKPLDHSSQKTISCTAQPPARPAPTVQHDGPSPMIPAYAIFPAASNGFVASPAPIPFPSGSHIMPAGDASRTESRSGSRTGSLFSVAITPASYDSRATSPLASPVSSSPDVEKEDSVSATKPSPAFTLPPRPRTISNPLLAQVLHRRVGSSGEVFRAQSLYSSPTSDITPCHSQNMGSFAPPDCAELQLKLQSTSAQFRARTLSSAEASTTAKRSRSATLPSSGIASQTLRALATVDTNKSSRSRPALPWSKQWLLWNSIREEPGPHGTTPTSEPVTPLIRCRPEADDSSIRSAPACVDAGGPLPPMDPTLARQERNSRLLETRECAACGSHGGSFPQCARGCGVAWCSRECRIENRATHNAVCRLALSKAGQMNTRYGTVA